MSDGEPQRKLELPEFPEWAYAPYWAATFRRPGDDMPWVLAQAGLEPGDDEDEIVLDAAQWRSLARFILDNVEDEA